MIDTTGKPLFCDIDIILDAAEQYILSDDGQKAIWILDNLPAYYQDNYPARAYQIKKDYFKRLWSVADYLSESFENVWDEKKAIEHYKHKFQYRGQYIRDLIKLHNDAGCDDIHIVEVGAANYWLPLGLRDEGLKFKYLALGHNVDANKQAAEKLKDIWSDEVITSTIFVCMEVVEHCFNPQDIFNYYCKFGREAEYIVLTTPRYMVGGGVPDWRSRSLGHVKTWGSGEFQAWAEKTWPLHNFYVHDRSHLIVRGFMRKLEEITRVQKTIDDTEA